MLHPAKGRLVAIALLGVLASLVATPVRAELPANLKPTLILARADEEEPPPIAKEDLEEEEKRAKREQERKRKQEIDELPAYKRPWFWVLTAVVVGAGVTTGILLANKKDPPAKACSMGLVGCFGDGR
jgi:hypothetical protein